MASYPGQFACCLESTGSSCRRIEEWAKREPVFKPYWTESKYVALRGKAATATGWTSNSTNWYKQKDYMTSKLPTLLRTRIDGRKIVIWVDLVSLDGSLEGEEN